MSYLLARLAVGRAALSSGWCLGRVGTATTTVAATQLRRCLSSGAKPPVSTPTPSASPVSVAERIARLNQKVAQCKTSNVLIYSCDTKGSTAVNTMGVFMCALMLVTSISVYDMLGSVRFRQSRPDSDSEHSGVFYTSMQSILRSEYFRVVACASTAIIAVIILAGSMFATSRSVHKLYLLKGGKSIGVVTDGMFGRNFKYTMQLNETRFQAVRSETKNQVAFKNDQHYFFFLMSMSNAQFYEQELFDDFICTTR